MIGFFAHSPSGCYWYRIKHPMDALATHGVPTEMMQLDTDIILDNLKTIQVYGIYPFSFEKVLKYLKEEGKKIVYDLDDALDMIEPTNPFYYAVKKDAFSEQEIFKYADHITVSTPFIAQYARKKTDKPITIVPNCYIAEEWNFPRIEKPTIRIGFAGSCTHIEDLLMVLPAIKNLQKKYDITFVLMGFGKEDYPTWLRQFAFASPPEGKKALGEFVTILEDMKYEWVPFTDFQNYPRQLVNLGLDIGLCPLKNTPFNRARSASKAMEYLLSGAIAVASNLEPYQNEPTSILVNDDQWEQELEKLIFDGEKAKEIYNKHLQWIKDNRNINTQIELLKSIYVV